MGGNGKEYNQLLFVLIGALFGFVVGLKMFKKGKEDELNKPFWKQKWFKGSLLIAVIFALVFFMMYQAISDFIDTLLPSSCGTGLLGEPDFGCWMLNFFKLFMIAFIIIILIKVF